MRGSDERRWNSKARTPAWYKSRCRECAWATLYRRKVTCGKGKFEPLSLGRFMVQSPVYASRCRDYEPMDLEPDGSPIEGADYPDREAQ